MIIISSYFFYQETQQQETVLWVSWSWCDKMMDKSQTLLLVVSVLFTFPPLWEAADAEIEVPSVENT